MSIQRHFILFILSLLVITPSIAHQKPYVINFARDKYHAANKNWTIGQDEKGSVFECSWFSYFSAFHNSMSEQK